MTAPMTPRDPFTYEDVRKAARLIWDWNAPPKEPTPREDRAYCAFAREVLLAGTERLRAQGTWNEAIEAAAKLCRDKEASAEAEYQATPHGRASDMHEFEADCARELADKIAALKRPEAP